MEDKLFLFTPELSNKLIQLKFENDWLFRKQKQPWADFHELLLQNGFPKEMTIDQVRKKWSYTLDMYRIAKRTGNTSWKYYKLFEKHCDKSKLLDKYSSWSDEWRLKLITCISESKELNLDYRNMWSTIEQAMRIQDLPIDCCIQDIKGLWQHIRMTFQRKHRLKLKKSEENSDWPLYDYMLSYFQKYEPDYLGQLETETPRQFLRKLLRAKHSYKKRKDTDKNDNEEKEFQWNTHITESFIQIRLQNDWLFREKKWAWNDMMKIMLEEGFPPTLTAREIRKKWASTFSEYQKAKATGNKQWVYYNLFEVYLGDSTLNLNPLGKWQEEWVLNLITARTDFDHIFRSSVRDQTPGWREVEKRLRTLNLPLECSLLDMPNIWEHLWKTMKWKLKFANRGILNEPWPYFEAMSKCIETTDKRPIYKQMQDLTKRKRRMTRYVDMDTANDDDLEDDMRLFDLKQKLESIKPKYEYEFSNHCRACFNEDGYVNIFDEKDGDGLDVAHKLMVIGGVEILKSDKLPIQVCFNCLQDLENAYRFRRKCQEADEQFRSGPNMIKEESFDHKMLNEEQNVHDGTKEEIDGNDVDMDFDTDIIDTSTNTEDKQSIKKERKIRKKKIRRPKYVYSKVCEICGKNTTNLRSHIDSHSTGKEYSCDVCDKKFKFKSGLILHKAVHNPTPKKTCEVCGKTFHILAQYRRHFVYHANERKYGCDTCGKRFNTPDILRVHSRMHTDERPFSCSECGKTFRTAGCVSRHKRIVHKNTRKIQ